VKRVNASELANRLRNLIGRPSDQPKWLVVADVNVFVRAIGGNPAGPNRKIVEAAALGVILLVTSDQIVAETIEVLQREDVGGYGRDEAADLMDPICRSARFVTPAADDPQYAKVVRDVDDIIILRTAAAIFYEHDLAALPHLFVVSGDKHAFPAGRNWYGFRYREAAAFWRELTAGIVGPD
jgi:predicted nucleic acid-binding protein